MTEPDTINSPAVSIWTDARPELGERSGQRRYEELLEEARFADELPFRAFCTTEQHGVDDGYLPAQLTLIAGLATATQRLRFITSALLILFHPWRQVVEQAIVADLLSQGRLELGVAAGGFKREFDLFGVDMSRRRELMDEVIPFIRGGFRDGELPDGPDGTMLPVLPPPVQAHLPIYVGGLAPPVIDRAVRLADGVMPYDFFRPDESMPRFWNERLKPALERHGRTLDDFRFIFCTTLWVADDPERDWEEIIRPSMEYQHGKYAEWAGESIEPGYATPDSLRDRANILVGTPENLASRLSTIRRACPFHEIMFWYRVPGITHDQSIAHLDRVANKLIPLLRG